MASPPFDLVSLRFARVVDDDRVIADLQLPGPPVIPDADWDRERDRAFSFASPTSAIAVVAPRVARLEVQARFSRMAPLRRWKIWAADPGGGPLAQVGDTTIEVRRPDCVSREVLFEVPAGGLKAGGVGRHEVTWRWMAQKVNAAGRPTADPQGLCETSFVVYAVAGLPEAAPWRQALHPDGNRDLLRPAILDLACDAAAGAQTPQEAGARLTRSLFALGSPTRPSQGKRQFLYGNHDDFTCSRAHHMFRCRAFQSAMDEPVTRGPVRLGCDDINTAVVVLGNALGLDLTRRIVAIPGRGLTLREVELIGEEVSTPAAWAHHVVAWSKTLGGVFDACLRVNVETHGTPRFETPAGMPFGEPDAAAPTRGYRHHLLAQDADRCVFEDLPATVLDRAAVGAEDADSEFEDAARRYLQLLRADTPPIALVDFPLGPDRLAAPDGFERALPITQSDGFIDASWTRQSNSADRLRLIAEAADGPDASLELAAWRLTFFREQLSVRTDPAVPGALVLSTADGQDVVLVFANAVVGLSASTAAPVNVLSAFAPVLSAVIVPVR